MSTTRIAGDWKLYISTIEHTPELLSLDKPVEASLTVLVANRAGVEAEMTLGGSTAFVKGRVRPGTPSVLTLEESGQDGTPIDDGLEAILYVPPWRPNIDYDFDILCGTMVLGANSALGTENMRSKVLVINGLQNAE